jgi:hypothetical protein
MPASDRGDGLATDGSGAPEDPTDQEVVQTAAEAAENVIFSRFSRSEVSDVDVSVSFEDGILEVDVYLDAEGDADPDRVADDAALAARGAVDDLFEA